MELNFEIARDLQNRLSAAHVRFGPVISRGQREKRLGAGSGSTWLAATVALCALLAIGLAAARGWVPAFLPVVFLVASGAVFLAYAFDKSAAMNRRRRTPENVLHLVNLLGGWPGGLFAAQLFHHKSKKLGFRAVFYLCIVLNCAAVGWIAHARPF